MCVFLLWLRTPLSARTGGSSRADGAGCKWAKDAEAKEEGGDVLLSREARQRPFLAGLPGVGTQPQRAA